MSIWLLYPLERWFVMSACTLLVQVSALDLLRRNMRAVQWRFAKLIFAVSGEVRRS
jgi:hypothetical protein